MKKNRRNRYLLDSSVLIAAAISDHECYPAVVRWLQKGHPTILTCPITQGALARTLIRSGNVALSDFVRVMRSIAESLDHEFIPDDAPYPTIDGSRIVGHQQVTDAYLAHLARQHGLTLATLDRAQAALYPDVCELIDS